MAEVEASGSLVANGNRTHVSNLEDNLCSGPDLRVENFAAPKSAREVLDCNREEFLQAFADGLAVLGYQRDEAGKWQIPTGKVG